MWHGGVQLVIYVGFEHVLARILRHNDEDEDDEDEDDDEDVLSFLLATFHDNFSKEERRRRNKRYTTTNGDN